MLAIGLILILLAAGALIAVLATGTDDQAALFGSTLEMPTLVVFLAGAATLLVFIMGLELTRSGLRRANRTRRDRKRLRKLDKQRGDEPVTGDTGGTGSSADTGGTGSSADTGTTGNAGTPHSAGPDSLPGTRTSDGGGAPGPTDSGRRD
jgi:hypothetical protein